VAGSSGSHGSMDPGHQWQHTKLPMTAPPTKRRSASASRQLEQRYLDEGGIQHSRGRHNSVSSQALLLGARVPSSRPSADGRTGTGRNVVRSRVKAVGHGVGSQPVTGCYCSRSYTRPGGG